MKRPPRRHRLRAALLGFASLTAAAVLAQEPFRITFVHPRHLQPVLGRTPIELEIEAPPNRRVTQVEVFADGALVGRLTAPPWTLAWDAGQEPRGHELAAVAYLDDGRLARVQIRTTPVQLVERTRVVLVNVDAFVRDTEGRYVTDLTRDDFVLLENGHPEAIDRFSTVRKPLRVAIVLDTSLTMEKQGRLESAKKAGVGFLKTLGPEDKAALVAFSDEVRVVQALTSDKAALRRAILSLSLGGGTALYDAIWRASRLLSEYDGRRVLVLLSDGRDEAASGLEPGSLHTLGEALERAQRDEVIVFAVGVGKHLDRELDFYERRSLRSILEELARETGGRAVFVESRPGRLRRAFADVAEDLRHMYSLAYVPDDQSRDGSWRRIELRVKKPGLTVYARRGYFAD